MNSAASQQAVVEAALVLLERMGLTAADLAAVPQHRPVMPTFAEYVPVVSAAVSAGTRRAYGSYWNRVINQRGDRRLDEPTPSEIRQLMAYVKTHVVARRNARGGRSAEEHLVAALRCLYKRAVDEGLITEAGNPARKVAKPRRLPTTRRALPDTRLAQINQVAATTGDDPELDTLILRLHTETACRRGGALALRPRDLDPEQCLVLLREKGETVRWQPVDNLRVHTFHFQLDLVLTIDVAAVTVQNGRLVSVKAGDGSAAGTLTLKMPGGDAVLLHRERKFDLHLTIRVGNGIPLPTREQRPATALGSSAARQDPGGWPGWDSYIRKRDA